MRKTVVALIEPSSSHTKLPEAPIEAATTLQHACLVSMPMTTFLVVA